MFTFVFSQNFSLANAQRKYTCFFVKTTENTEKIFWLFLSIGSLCLLRFERLLMKSMLRSTFYFGFTSDIFLGHRGIDFWVENTIKYVYMKILSRLRKVNLTRWKCFFTQRECAAFVLFSTFLFLKSDMHDNWRKIIQTMTTLLFRVA
jgi:hypothetical protein